MLVAKAESRNKKDVDAVPIPSKPGAVLPAVVLKQLVAVVTGNEDSHGDAVESNAVRTTFALRQYLGVPTVWRRDAWDLWKFKLPKCCSFCCRQDDDVRHCIQGFR